MATSEPRYAMATIGAELERARLEKLQAIHDPQTLGRLDRLGIEPGMRCVEVGAGAGSIARALAARVGASGLVVAADMDPRFLADFKGPGRAVVTHDITTGSVAPGDFDLVHCRALLAHVADVQGAVDHLVASARPGGLVFCEEPDYGGCAPCDPTHPAAPVFERYLAGVMAGARMDPLAGRHVHAALRRAGLEAMGSEIGSEIVVGGSARALYRRETMANVREQAVSAGGYTEADYQALLDCFEDPSFAYVDALWVGVWGRRPDGGRRRA